MKLETKDLRRSQLHDLLGNSLSPLPIALVSTVGADGSYNAAPFSFACPVCSKPPIVCVSIALRAGVKKDTQKNMESALDFVINVVDEGLIKQAVQAAADYPYGVSEMKASGLTAVKSDKVKAPRIAEAKVSLECRLINKLDFIEEYREGTGLRSVLFGEVVLAHIKDEVWSGTEIDPRKLKAIGRLASNLYVRPTDLFELKVPKV